MNHSRTRLAALVAVLTLLTVTLRAQVPQLVNYQGRVAVGTVNFEGSGQFKFALVNAAGSTTYWSNNGSSVAGAQPTAAVTLTVTKGLYSVLLGDTTLANMTAVPASVFNNTDVRLRVWFNDGINGSQLLTPDQRIAAVGYAMLAGNVPDGAITSAKIANGAIGSTQLGSGLTLGGTTSGTFSGSLAGNAATATSATTATSAGSFTGSLAGNVTGTQGATVVSTVGGVTAANVATGANLANAATNASTANTLVKRDASGNFSAGTITVAGDLSLPATSSATVGVITQGGNRLIHSFGSANFFAGFGAGNFTMTGGNNTASGSFALQGNTTGEENTASGVSALGVNTTGNGNTASGSFALQSNTMGSQNTAGGSFALSANTTGSANTASGYQALSSNTTGGNNTVSGNLALLSNTTGERNTASGSFALFANTTAGQNVAIGNSALSTQSFNNSGTAWSSNNVALGFQALLANQPTSTANGINNTALGNFALAANTTGASNIALGYNAGNLLTTGSNNIHIGHVGVAAETNIIRIGTSQTDTYLTGVIHGNGSGLTGVAASALTGTITGAQITTGAVGSPQLASGLTLGGTTSGTFSGSLAGNAATATSAGSFTGALSGNVTGTQGATVVSTVGGVTAANVATGANLANAATNANTASTIVKRDASGNFSAGTITIAGDLTLPATSSATVGVITQGATRLIHSFGSLNFFGGLSAGNFTMTGGSNTATGVGALQGDTTGAANTASGANALQSNTTGSNNTASGSGALVFNTTGDFNTANGYSALSNNTTAGDNVAIGSGALNAQSFNNAGTAWNSNNVAVGSQALQSNQPISTSTGINNTALGFHALLANTTGANNIAVGNNAGNLLTTGNYNIDIGHAGVAAETATIRLGTAGSQTKTFVAGIRSITTGVNDAVAVLIDSNGQLGTVSSSRRYKEDIADMGDASARLRALRPVTFRYKAPYADGGKPIQFGLIAEEVAEVFPELAVFNDEGQPETVKYQDLTPLLLNEVQKLTAEKDELKKQLDETNARLSRLESLLSSANTKGH